MIRIKYQSQFLIVMATCMLIGRTHVRPTPESAADQAVDQLGAYVLFYSKLPKSPDELRQAKGLSNTKPNWDILGSFSIKAVGKQVAQISFINSQGQPDYRNVMLSGRSPLDLLPNLAKDPYFYSDSDILKMSSRLTDPKTLMILSH
jgi:hypothetical protein